MTDPDTSRDNRRLVVRVFSQELLSVLTDWARANGEDLIASLIFTGVWTSNVAHLSPRPALRYADFKDIPPDSLRVPIPTDELATMLCLPKSIVTVYVRELAQRGLIEETGGGLVVPSAVIARMTTLENLAATYARARTLVDRLREAGLQTETDPDAKPEIGK